ncbi:VOC family protein [Paraburkholderia fungorum]
MPFRPVRICPARRLSHRNLRGHRCRAASACATHSRTGSAYAHNKHVCFAVRSVRETVAALRDTGANIALEPEIHGNPMAFVRDVAGNLIEFVEAFSSASDMPPV